MEFAENQSYLSRNNSLKELYKHLFLNAIFFTLFQKLFLWSIVNYL